MFHRHKWELKDKTVIAPSNSDLDMGEGTRVRGAGAVGRFARMVERMALGYVVLTFTWPCGKYRIEKR